MKNKEYYATRRPFTPIPGETYENEGGGTFICLPSFPLEVEGYMKNTRSGWTLQAHGCGIYEDGRIDWDYSTGLGFSGRE